VCEVVQLVELGYRSGMIMLGIALLGPKLGKINQAWQFRSLSEK